MQELLLGSFGSQLVAFVSRYPWPIFAVLLVVSLIVIDLLRRNRSPATTGGDIDLGFLATEAATAAVAATEPATARD